MTRRLLNFLTALSLLLCVGTVAGWVRAQMGDHVWVRFVGNSLLVHGASGQDAESARGYFFEPARPRDATYEGPAGLLRVLRKGSWGARRAAFAGVEFYADASPVPMHRTLVVPVAYPLLLTAALPAVWVYWRLRGERRSRRGCCATCGYDLRATPDKCPECGAEAAARTAP